MPRMNEKTANLQQNQGARKLKGREILRCVKIRGAKIEGRKFKGALILMGIRNIVRIDVYVVCVSYL